ncbi:hypothetical protein Tco_0015562 [Tanacetum coccineum]
MLPYRWLYRCRADLCLSPAVVVGGNRVARAKRKMKKRVVMRADTFPLPSHKSPLRDLREDYGNTSGSIISRLILPVENLLGHKPISTTASAPAVLVCPSKRYCYTPSDDRGHHCNDLCLCCRYLRPVALTDGNKDKNVPTPSIFAVSSSSEKTDRTLSLFAVTSLESTIAEKDRELSDLETSSSSLRCASWKLLSASLREKLETYEGSMKQLEEFQDNLMKPFEARLAEIDADFTRCCMHFHDSFHPHLLNVIAGRRWLLAHGMRLLMAKCLNSSEYMEALGNAFGHAIEKGMQEGLAAGIVYGQARRCLNDLEAYNPSVEDDFNSAVQATPYLTLHPNSPLLQELSAKRDANTLDVMDLLRLDDAVAEVLGMTGLQPDVSQLMVPPETNVESKIKMEMNLTERLPILKDVFTSIDHPLSVEALTVLPETFIEPPVATPATNVLSTVVIRPTPDFLSIQWKIMRTHF